MSLGGPTICALCTRLRATAATNKAGDDVFSCDAFPDGVPAEIQFGGFDHREPFKGDGGIHFKAKGGVKIDEVDSTLAAAKAFLT